MRARTILRRQILIFPFFIHPIAAVALISRGFDCPPNMGASPIDPTNSFFDELVGKFSLVYRPPYVVRACRNIVYSCNIIQILNLNAKDTIEREMKFAGEIFSSRLSHSIAALQTGFDLR